MGRLFLRRLAGLLATLFGASLIVFTVLNVLPGDPAQVMLGVNARPDTLAALRTQLGLDQVAPVRYLAWLAHLAHGDLGRSYTYSVPVADLVRERLGVSGPLALMAILLTVVIAIPAGVLAAARRGEAADAGVMGFVQLGVAVPNFWLGILMILLFAVKLGWFQAGGFPGWEAGMWPAIKALLLPALALALPQAAILARVTRTSMLETLHEDYVRTARAKGLAAAATLWRHALPNALIPIVTVMGLQFSFLLAGTIVIENVFYLPGLGRLIFQAIAQRDLIVVQGLVVLLVGTVVAVTFLVDLLYLWFDPRLRADG